MHDSSNITTVYNFLKKRYLGQKEIVHNQFLQKIQRKKRLQTIQNIAIHLEFFSELIRRETIEESQTDHYFLLKAERPMMEYFQTFDLEIQVDSLKNSSLNKRKLVLFH
ncbi:hypothetical protein ANCCAN_10004 [Ancylostoma caninum]|uniref:Uncharacterized protein n=1 Tax=Ancylostoma caninum TaxID=29170 RepID=A0A368GM67_ANCCA|nr:hypothetical protein ANCCAN_10004 [Ancylostoma caninum]